MATPSPERFGRTLIAGAVGLAWSTVGLVVLLVIGAITLQAGLQWYARGSIDLFPRAGAGPRARSDVAVISATPEQASAIRHAVASLTYRLPRNAVTFGITNKPPCPMCVGFYQPATGLIQIERSAVDEGGAFLERAVAHEIGHFVDFRYLSEGDRSSFRRLRAIPEDIRWTDAREPWKRRPAEDFAEVFATLAVPAVVSPPQTAWGRVGNADEMTALLRRTGVKFDGTKHPGGLQPLVEQQLAFLRYSLADPPSRALVQALILLYIAIGTIGRMVEAWRR